jgi:class 3 adenylate cyclase
MTTESVAILFTDVVSSTELANRLAPSDADEWRRRHFAILRDALGQSGGTEVKSLGDGVMAAFVSASAALGCAVAMQQRVHRDNRRHGLAVGLRIGIGGGEVAKEGGDYFGDPVIEAARLCASCEGGQIRAAEVVRLMAGRRAAVAHRPLGAMALKGIREPVDTVEIGWEPLPGAGSGAHVPLQARLTVRPSVGVVGRGSELATLADAYKRAGVGHHPELILVSGEAGLGKTTLVAEAARAAHDTGAMVLFGRCEEDVATPYQLFAMALGHYVAHASSDALRAHVDEHGPGLVRLVPQLAQRVAGLAPAASSDPDTERYLLFAAVVGLLASASAVEPVVLVLDDLQWADAGSLSLLRHVTASDASMRLLVIGTYRDSELSHAHALRDTLGVLRRHTEVDRIDLSGLDDEAVVTFMEAAAGHDLDDTGIGLAHAVYRETDGNPFFVGEVLRHLAETGAIWQDDTGRWSAMASLEPSALPDSVREVIGGRVARLGPPAERLLPVAAVIGRDFDLALLSRASTLPEDALLDILDAATAAALVREVPQRPGHYTFAHALIQHTIYQDLGPTRRARLHRQVADALEDLCGAHPGRRVGELARHWANATQPIDLAKAVTYAHLAGDAALEALAPADAMAYFSQATELAGELPRQDPALTVELAIGTGTAQRQVGDPAFRETLLDAARRAATAGDTDRLVAATLANDRGFYSTVGVTDAEKVALLELALDRMGPTHVARPLVLATLCSELAHGSSLERRRGLADEAFALAEAGGDDATVVRVLNHVFVPLQVPHLLELGLRWTTSAHDRAERLGDPALRYWAAMWRAETAARAGDVEEMDRCLEIHAAMAERLDQPAFHWGAAFVRGLRAFIAGDTDEGERQATRALEIGTAGGQPDATVIFGAQLMITHGQRGTMSELIPLIEQLRTDAPDISPWLFGSLLAKAHVEVGRTDEARRLLDEFDASGYALPLDQVWLTGMVDYAEAAIDCAAPEYAGPLYEHLAPFAGQLPATGASALAPVSYYLGGLCTVLGRFDEAAHHYEASAAMSVRIGGRFFAARTQLGQARLLLERAGAADVEQGRRLAEQARSAAAASGYGGIERGALELLSRSGPPAPTV